MDNVIVTSIVVLGSMGLIIGALLAIASVVFEVKVDPREQEVYEALPHFNCGACGYPGCRGMAQGLMKSEVPISNCKPSKPAARQKIHEMLDSFEIPNKM